jgi:hypothetical protein
MGFIEAGPFGAHGRHDPRDGSFAPLDAGWVVENGGGAGARIGDVAGRGSGGVFLL